MFNALLLEHAKYINMLESEVNQLMEERRAYLIGDREP
jgi:hypothetical protein